MKNLLFILSIFSSLLAQANEIKSTDNAASTLSLEEQCVLACERVSGLQSQKARSLFSNNCRAVILKDTEPLTFSKAIAATAEVVDRTFLRCFPDAGVKAFWGNVEFIKSLPYLIGYLFTPDSSPRQPSGPSRAQIKQECSNNKSCRRSLGRMLISYQGKNLDGTYSVSDDELDQKLSLMDNETLWTMAEHQKEAMKRYCSAELHTIRSRHLRNSEEYGFEEQKKVFVEFLKAEPICPSLLNFRPPELQAMPKDNRTLLEKLTLGEQLAITRACAGEEAFGDVIVEHCSEVMQYFVPLPIKWSKILKLPGRPKGKPPIGEASAEKKFAVTAAISKSEKVKEFTNNYSSKIYATEAQNDVFIQGAKSANEVTDESVRFLDVENSVMKKLNDETNNKDLVTAITNYHKEIFRENYKKIERKYKEMGFQLDPYEDFKSGKRRFKAPAGMSPQLEKELFDDLQNVFGETNKEFAIRIKELGISVPAAGNPEQWFRGGFGKTADQASIAARRSRRFDDQPGLLSYSAPEVQAGLQQTLGKVELDRIAMSMRDNFKHLMQKNSNGQLIPRDDVFELTRKYNNEKDLVTAVHNRFGVKSFSENDARLLLRYTKRADEFSPTIFISKRDSIGMKAGREGAVSCDFLGMGAQNSCATSAGLAGARNLDEAIKRVRAGEGEVTKTFEAKKKRFAEIVGGEVHCSGDDCIKIAEKAMTPAQKTKMINDLVKDEKTRGVRVAFVGRGVPEEYRLLISTEGEALEKATRRLLEGKIPREKLKNLVFGFDMQTLKESQGQVSLIIGKRSETPLSRKHQGEIVKAFEQAIAEANSKRAAFQPNQVQYTERLLVPIGTIYLPEDEEI